MIALRIVLIHAPREANFPSGGPGVALKPNPRPFVLVIPIEAGGAA
jgi:hypothetical protein